MLIYHPAYDAYHCIFRSLLITNAFGSIELQKLRLLDFFLVFPSEVANIRLPQNLKGLRKIASELSNDYHGPVSKVQAFRDMEHIQLTAYSALAALEIFDPTSYQNGVAIRTSKLVQNELIKKIKEAEERDRLVLDCVLHKLGSIPLLGMDGLKDRSGLMEYRYDIA